MEFDSPDPRIDEGIRLFNDREFFACHDVFEDFWGELTGPEKPFFQGLIQSAVALFHFEERNLGGARKMAGSAILYLRPFAPTFCRIDVSGLIVSLESCFEELCAPHSAYPSHVILDPRRIPVIHRRPAHAESADRPNYSPSPEVG